MKQLIITINYNKKDSSETEDDLIANALLAAIEASLQRMEYEYRLVAE